jgi:hypothetical protein
MSDRARGRGARGLPGRFFRRTADEYETYCQRHISISIGFLIYDFLTPSPGGVFGGDDGLGDGPVAEEVVAEAACDTARRVPQPASAMVAEITGGE